MKKIFIIFFIFVYNTQIFSASSEKDSLAEEYQKLPSLSRRERDSLCIYGSKFVGTGHNRYGDILPFDKNRVEIPIDSDLGIHMDYVNASWVDIQDSKIILTQAPTKQSFEHFWWMIWNQDIQYIAMLTDLFETKGGWLQEKSFLYWPEKKDESVKILNGHMHITCLSESSFEDNSNGKKNIIREFQMTFTPFEGAKKETKKVKHFHYRQWPDFGVPSSSDDLVRILQDFVNLRQENLESTKSNITPFVVHCSAGCGRAGVLAAAFRMILTRESIFEAVKNIRNFRVNAVQTADQYSYTADLAQRYYETMRK